VRRVLTRNREVGALEARSKRSLESYMAVLWGSAKIQAWAILQPRECHPHRFLCLTMCSGYRACD
jgi:hypothetical protein